MSKTRDTGFLGNVVKYDANGNVTVVNGATTLLSVSSSGQLTVPGDEVITGSLTVLGGITGAITGSATSASYAANTSLLNGSGSGEFVPTGSFNTFSSSILTYTGSANSRLGSLETTSGSNITRLGALESASGSAITRLNSIESTTGSLNTASGSAITRLSALEVTSGSNITRISALETASGSAITRLSSIESKTGSYATTGSNTFVGGQYLSSSFNPTGFSTTASLYTDGGLRVSRDAYISGTLYLNNVTVFGTQSVSYISSSQLNIGTNIISVNTDTPSVRFGGLAVYDSGSTGLTGSILWDSQDNQWIYSNPSGSTYDSAMFLVGPRNTGTLGNEVGINCNFLSKGNGMHHMTSSAIFEDGSRTCFYGNSFISSSGAACFAGTVCSAGNVTTNLTTTGMSGAVITIRGDESLNSNFGITWTTPTYTGGIAAIRVARRGATDASDMMFFTSPNGDIPSERLRITSTGIACFASNVCVGNSLIVGSTSVFGSDMFTYLNGGIFFSGGGSYNAGIFGRNGGCDLILQSGGAQRVNINSSGVACFSGNVCVAEKIIVKNGSNSIFAWADATDAQPGSHTVGCIGSGTTELYSKLYMNVNAGLFGQSNQCMAFVGTAGACNRGLLFGTVNSAPIFIGTANSNRLQIEASGIATFACQVCAPRITIPILRLSDETTFGLTACKGPNGYPIFHADGAQGIGFLTAESSTFGERLRIFHTGAACFSCQICAPSTYLNSSNIGTLLLGATPGSSQIAARITGTCSPSYNATGKLGFSVTTWGANTDYGLTEVMAIDMRNADNKNPVIWMNPFGGKVGIGNTNPNNIFDIYDQTYNSNTVGVLAARTRGGGTFITGRVVTAEVSNQTQTIATFSAAGTNERIFVKVQVVNVSAVNNYGNVHVGYAIWSGSGGSTVTTMTLDSGNSNISNTNVGSLSWSGNNLQYTTNRGGNYELNSITIWASARDTGVIA